jgi:peroxiredoxin
VRPGIWRTGSALLLAAALAATASERRGGPSRVGQMAPAFTLPDLLGRPVSLESFRGRQVVQIVGWATWCPVCLREIPRLADAYEKHHSDGFEILAVTGPQGQELGLLKSFARENEIPYPILYDRENRVFQDYGIYFIPYTCLLDRSGKIVYEGSHLPNDYEQRIEQLLADNGSS